MPADRYPLATTDAVLPGNLNRAAKSALRMVILDRDGVVNEDSDAYIKSVEEWIPIPGSLQAIARLNHAGVRVAVVSNQSGIGRGLFGINALNAMHRKLRDELAHVGGHVDGIFFCPHRPDEGCRCRKPGTALLESLSRRFSMPLRAVPFVGDSNSDIEAARAVHALPVLVRTGKGQRTLAQNPQLSQDVLIFDDLSAVVEHLLASGAEG